MNESPKNTVNHRRRADQVHAIRPVAQGHATQRRKVAQVRAMRRDPALDINTAFDDACFDQHFSKLQWN